MAARTTPQSSALRAMGPSLSIEYASDMAPWRLTRPYVGRNPEIPVNVDGHTIEPQVSEPIAKAAMPEQTIAADPLDDPQVQQPSFHGLRAAPVCDAEAKRYPMPPAS